MPDLRPLATGCLLAALSLLPGSGEAQPPAGGAGPVPTKAAPLTEAAVVARVEQAIDRGLKHLAARQLADGSWHNNQAVNGLAILSFLGRGHVPGRGQYAELLENAKRALLRGQNEQGMFGATMYEHGLATLACVELYAWIPTPWWNRNSARR